MRDLTPGARLRSSSCTRNRNSIINSGAGELPGGHRPRQGLRVLRDDFSSTMTRAGTGPGSSEPCRTPPSQPRPLWLSRRSQSYGDPELPTL